MKDIEKGNLYIAALLALVAFILLFAVSFVIVDMGLFK